MIKVYYKRMSAALQIPSKFEDWAEFCNCVTDLRKQGYTFSPGDKVYSIVATSPQGNRIIFEAGTHDTYEWMVDLIKALL